MNSEENAFQQMVAYLQAIGNPVRKEQRGWDTTEEDVRRYVTGFRVNGVFSEEKFSKTFKGTMNENLEHKLSQADSPSSLNGVLHAAKDHQSAVLYGQVLVDVNGLAIRVAEKAGEWLAQTSYDQMRAVDLALLANNLRVLLGDNEAVQNFDTQALVYFKAPLNEALKMDEFESLESKGTGAFRRVVSRFYEVFRASPAAKSINLEDYLGEGLKSEIQILDVIAPQLEEIRSTEKDYLAYIKGLKLVGNESRELWVDLYEREQRSIERLQRVVAYYDSLKMVVTKLRNCFSPKFENEAVLADVYKSVDITDERFRFSFDQPPLLTELREAERTMEEIKILYKEKVHKTVLYQWFDVCYAQNSGFERAEELRTAIKMCDQEYVGLFRHLGDKLLACRSLDFI